MFQPKDGQLDQYWSKEYESGLVASRGYTEKDVIWGWFITDRHFYAPGYLKLLFFYDIMFLMRECQHKGRG